MGLVARHTRVFQELGITRGQYTGLLPLLVRHGVASLFIMPEQDAAAAAAAAAAGTAAGGAAGGGGGGAARAPADGGWEEVSDFLLFVDIRSAGQDPHGLCVWYEVAALYAGRGKEKSVSDTPGKVFLAVGGLRHSPIQRRRRPLSCLPRGRP